MRRCELLPELIYSVKLGYDTAMSTVSVSGLGEEVGVTSGVMSDAIQSNIDFKR